MVDLAGWLDYLLDSFWNLVFDSFAAVYEFFQDAVFYIFRLVLDFGLFILSVIDSMMPSVDVAPAWTSIGQDFLMILSYIGFPSAMLMLVAAMTIRLILNFIPLIG